MAPTSSRNSAAVRATASHWPTLPARATDAHKRSAGAVIVVGGAPTMIGAPTFVALGALRTGCGYVRLAVPTVIRSACLSLLPEVIAVATDPAGRWLKDVSDGTLVAFGPGMAATASDAGPRRLLAALIARGLPLVIDGGGLSVLAALGTQGLHPGQVVVTPHPGEYARLAHALHLPAVDTGGRAERLVAARALAETCRGAVVLKGPETVICAATAANDRRHLRDDIGGPELAIPGSGDCLTGIIGALRARGMDAFAAAALGVRLHSRAGRMWARRGAVEGLLATELAGLVPAAIAEHRSARTK